MANPFSSTGAKDLIDGLNKLSQIVALLVAGYWGYHLYEKTQKPGLELRPQIQVTSDWSEGPSGDTCIGSFTISVKNDGIRPFNISKYTISAWIFSESALLKSRSGDPTAPFYLNYDKIRDSAPFYTEPDVTDGDLVQHIPQGGEQHTSWDFIFSKSKTSDQGVLFSVDPDIDGQPVDSSWKSDTVCPKSVLEPPQKSTNSSPTP